MVVIMVQCSLDKDYYVKNIQYETVQKFRAAASNIYNSSLEGQGAVTMAKDTKNLLVTKCPTYSYFFECFNKGLDKQMSDITRPDRAISHEIVQELMSTLEQDQLSARASEHLILALEGGFLPAGFYFSLER